MMNKRKVILYKVVMLLLVVALVCPVNANAVEPRASDYLASYSAYVYSAGWGRIQVWFEVDGVDDMDEIGALELQIYESKDNENWYWVDTYSHTDYPNMLANNDYFYTSYVEYNGTMGRYYKAYVCVWAGKNGDGDTRYFWTSVKRATVFAE